ncbi:MAG: NAD(P)-dependent glycerol-3-phosphate dehydrogenase [Acetobacteraceae bacterium]|nr:NAD(P)-dependent glycerol-3-phosphate dehydrogenase [Acetobacteraceae bacterium]
MNDLAVLGAGAWGTALAIQALRAGNQVVLWARDPARAQLIAHSRHNPRLPGIRLPDEIFVTSDIPKASIILLATPMQFLGSVAARLQAPGKLVACCKGVETDTLKLPLEVLADLHPGVPLAILTGPNFAEEIASGKPAASVIAATGPALREEIAARLATPGFRLYGNDDPIGAQLGAAAKNVIAIAAGVVIGARLGENARAGLITRGLAELARLSTALGGKRETVMGLSGLGDLVLTCTGEASRNFTLGVALGRGESLAAVLAARTTVTEGVATAPALVARAGTLDLPICSAVAAILQGRSTPGEAVASVLARPRRDE